MSRMGYCLLGWMGIVSIGCGPPTERREDSEKNSQATVQEAEARGTIGFSALTLTNPFFQEIANHLETGLKEQGYELLVVSGERDVKKQADQIDDFIVKGVRAIVLNPCDSLSIGPAIQRANEAGIPVFTNDIRYDGSDGEVVCHVATDNFQGGKLAGEALVAALEPAGGKVAILHFPQAESCQLRVNGFREVIEAYNARPDSDPIEVVAILDGGGVRDEGFAAAKDALEANPDLAAIFAINDPSALGAYAALEASGKADQVTLIGFDGQPSGKAAIRDGKILCDPVQFPDRIGRVTAEMILKHFNGDEVDPVILIPSELYYQSDAEQDADLKG
jgi:ribose transport system substrate-binding protein